MAVAKKNRRKIVVDGRDFYWNVTEDEDEYYGGFILTIVSDDKHFLVRYPLNQPQNQLKFRANYIVVEGRDFYGNGNFGGSWQRVVCPIFDETEAVTPSTVREIILWSLTDKENTFAEWPGP
ncbi:MAG: hypothetical protein AAF902_19415 [Chloroflexota bacterium]